MQDVCIPYRNVPCHPAGKDYRDSVLKDAKTSLTVIAGGDPDLRQAVTDGKVKQVSRSRVVGVHCSTVPACLHICPVCTAIPHILAHVLLDLAWLSLTQCAH